jgi:hypothetical protein
MNEAQGGTPTAGHLTVPLDMIHGPGNFVLRLSVNAPEWQMMQGDYLICRPLAPGIDPPCCSHVIVRMDGAEHLRVGCRLPVCWRESSGSTERQDA